jgi:hypothetical protein
MSGDGGEAVVGISPGSIDFGVSDRPNETFNK